MKKIVAKNVSANISSYIGTAGEIFYDLTGDSRCQMEPHPAAF